MRQPSYFEPVQPIVLKDFAPTGPTWKEGTIGRKSGGDIAGKAIAVGLALGATGYAFGKWGGMPSRFAGGVIGFAGGVVGLVVSDPYDIWTEVVEAEAPEMDPETIKVTEEVVIPEK